MNTFILIGWFSIASLIVVASILQVNDDVVKVMSSYRKIVEGSTEENGLMLGKLHHAAYITYLIVY